MAANHATNHESQNIWYLDSGCSNHMTGNRDFFLDLDNKFHSQVKLGDGKIQSAIEKRVISSQTKGVTTSLSMMFFMFQT